MRTGENNVDNERQKMSAHGEMRWFILLSTENAHVLQLLLVSLAVSKKVLNLTEVLGEPERDYHFQGLTRSMQLPKCYLCASNCCRM